MIELLNHLVDEMETYLSDDVDVDGLAGAVGTTDYHLGRSVLVREDATGHDEDGSTVLPLAYD